MNAPDALTHDHQCWWTRRHETELVHGGDSLWGAGVPDSVLADAAASLGATMTSTPSEEDEYGVDVALGEHVEGTLHDGCFFSLQPATIELTAAVVNAVLALHSHYLGSEVDWSPIVRVLLDRWQPGTVLRMRTSPTNRILTVYCYEKGAGLLTRTLLRPIEVDCSSGVAGIR